MEDTNITELPLETPAGAASPQATDAFAVLGNETRLAILLALWEEHEPHVETNAVAFSTIFDRVDYDDPGSFRYHLEQLKGRFIRHREGVGYELRVPGLKFIQVVIAGAGVEDETIDATEIDQKCPFCNSWTSISYREGMVVQVCTQCEGTTKESIPGFLSAVPFDPAGLVERTADEIRAASRLAGWRQTQIMFEGLCPACSGPVDSWIDCCSDHDASGICDRCGMKFAVLARFQCRVCKNHNVSSPKALAMLLPDVQGFYANHGVSTRVHADDPESVDRVFDLMEGHRVEIIAEEPPRASVTARADGDGIILTFDETARVVDVSR